VRQSELDRRLKRADAEANMEAGGVTGNTVKELELTFPVTSP
jgi:hypothetical protein